MNTLQTAARRVVQALALIPDCDGVRDCYFCAAADMARAVAGKASS